ncbi:MAG: DUF1269 domain-containing protein [Methanoregula sp.]
MVEYGPIQIIAIGFPEIESLDGALLKEIFQLSDARIIRVLGLLAMVKDEKGKIASVQITELSDEDRIKLSAAVGALIGFGAAGKEGAIAGAEAGAERAAHKNFGLSQTQIRDITKEMPSGTAAGFLLIEHLWAKKFKETAMKKHGILLANSFISPAALVSLGTELAEGAKTAEKALDQYELQGGVCG